MRGGELLQIAEEAVIGEAEVVVHFAAGFFGVPVDESLIDRDVGAVHLLVAMERLGDVVKVGAELLEEVLLHGSEDGIAGEAGDFTVEFDVESDAFFTGDRAGKGEHRVERAAQREQVFQPSDLGGTADEFDFDQAAGIEQVKQVRLALRGRSRLSGVRGARGYVIWKTAEEGSRSGKNTQKTFPLGFKEGVSDNRGADVKEFRQLADGGELIPDLQTPVLHDLPESG